MEPTPQLAPLSYYLIHWLVSALAVFVTARIVPGIRVKGFMPALWAAALIGLLNIFIWPLLFILTLPINILTLGLFTFVVNGAMLKLAAGVLNDFQVDTWTAAILGSIVLSLAGMLLHYLIL